MDLRSTLSEIRISILKVISRLGFETKLFNACTIILKTRVKKFKIQMKMFRLEIY